METKVQPELVLRRRICELCGEGIFEFVPETQVKQEYICTDCSV